MIQFYKKRDFGTFVGDSFNFFKLYGKNYFKSYLLINGLLLVLMVAVAIFGYKQLLAPVFESNLGGDSAYFERYFSDNLGMLIVVGLLSFLLFMVLVIISYLFPVFYMKRIAQGAEKIKTDDIVNDFKENAGKIAKLCIGLTFIVAPLALFVIIFSYILIFIIIGFFLILLIYPTLFNVITFLMYDYFNSDRKFFERLSYSIRSQFSYPNGSEKSPYWKYWGASIIMITIISIISSIFTYIPIIFFYGALLGYTPNGNFEQNPFTGVVGILFFVFYGISMVLSFILSNLMYVNAGLMYYDSRTDLHQKVELAEIDTIGINE